jgi:hypothetical protein
MIKKSAKGPPKIMVQKLKNETDHLKGHLQLKTKLYQIEK